MNDFNNSKGASNGIKNQIKQTKGLPKESNLYGSRAYHSTRSIFHRMGYVSSNVGRRGRVADFLKIQRRSYCSVQNNNIGSDFEKIVEESKKHSKGIIDRNIYKFMLDKNFYYRAYNKIKSKSGNMTPGLDHETLDGISEEEIRNICEKLRDESFQFKVARRMNIAKKDGLERQLTIASPRDKLVQQVMVSILEPIFEPTFLEISHGFRPNKSVHTALKMVEERFRVTRWVIEGDISKCFDSFDHEIMIKIIRKRIKCQKFINLIYKALRAGYGEMGKTIKANIVGTSQGSILSPILCNIYLNEFDKFVWEIKEYFDFGKGIERNKEYYKLSTRFYRNIKIKKNLSNVNKKDKATLLKMNHSDFENSKFRRISYVRYADDWILGLRGSKMEVDEIKQKCEKFLLEELKLKLSAEKTKISNLMQDKVRFLGCKLYLKISPNLSKVRRYGKRYTRRSGPTMIMEAPILEILRRLEAAGFAQNGKSIPKGLLIHNSKEQIVNTYNSIFRGFVNFYSFAINRGALVSMLRHILWFSCGKTLATKFKLKSCAKVIKKFGKDYKGESKISFYKPDYKIIRGSKKFKTNIKTKINGLYGYPISKASLDNLVCKVCQSSENIEMHHIRMMRDIKDHHDLISRKMIKANRKQIPLCRKCHKLHHAKR